VPYYVFRIKPFTPLALIAEHAAFAPASAQAKAERALCGKGENVRVMFAESVEAAEDLLLMPRDAPPPGDT
jgi:hypothetical protein